MAIHVDFHADIDDAFRREGIFAPSIADLAVAELVSLWMADQTPDWPDTKEIVRDVPWSRECIIIGCWEFTHDAAGPQITKMRSSAAALINSVI